MSFLVGKQKNRKFIINCVITQKIGAGTVLCASSYFNTRLDQSFSIAWPNEKQKDSGNKFLSCNVLLYCISF